MKFNKKRNLPAENVASNNIEKLEEIKKEEQKEQVEQKQNEQEQTEQKPIIKNKGKFKKIVLASVAVITAVALVLGGGFALFNNNNDPFADLKPPTDFDDINDDIVANTDLDDFYYQFATVSNDNDDHTLVLNGTTDIENNDGDLEMVDTQIEYDINEEQFDLLNDLEIKVNEEIKTDKKGNESSLYFFENDYDSVSEQEAIQIKQLIRDVAKTTPESVEHMSYDEKVDYIIDYTRNQADNYILSDFTCLGRKFDSIKYRYSLFVNKGTKTDDKQDYFKITYEANQYLPYDKDSGEPDPGIVDGRYQLIDGVSRLVSSKKIEDVSLTRSEILKILANSKKDSYSLEQLMFPTSLIVPTKAQEYFNLKQVQDKLRQNLKDNKEPEKNK